MTRPHPAHLLLPALAASLVACGGGEAPPRQGSPPPEPEPAPRRAAVEEPGESRFGEPDPLEAALSGRGAVLRRPGESEAAYARRREAQLDAREEELTQGLAHVEEERRALTRAALAWLEMLAAGRGAVAPPFPRPEEAGPLAADLGAPGTEAGRRFASTALEAYANDPTVQERAAAPAVLEVRLDGRRGATYCHRPDGSLGYFTWQRADRGWVLAAAGGTERAALRRHARALRQGLANQHHAVEEALGALQRALRDGAPLRELFTPEATGTADALQTCPEAARLLAQASVEEVRVRDELGLAALRTARGPVDVLFLARSNGRLRVSALGGEGVARLLAGGAR